MRPMLFRNCTLRDWRRPGVVEEPCNEDAHDQTRCRAKNKQAGKSRRDKCEYCQKPNSGTFHVGSLSPPNLLLARYFAMNPSFGACLNLAVRPEGANHQWRKIPPSELSSDLVADERLAP